MDRPDWDTYFMTLCFLVAQRSVDESTKHGTVAVAQDRTILSTGYNSPPRGFKDENFPQERPLKYSFVCHSETNAINNAARSGICLKGCTFYVTGFPCPNCFQSIINCGAKNIIYGPVGSECVTEETISIVERLNDGPDISLRFCNPDICALLNKTENYYNKKVKTLETENENTRVR